MGEEKEIMNGEDRKEGGHRGRREKKRRGSEESMRDRYVLPFLSYLFLASISWI